MYQVDMKWIMDKRTEIWLLHTCISTCTLSNTLRKLQRCPQGLKHLMPLLQSTLIPWPASKAAESASQTTPPKSMTGHSTQDQHENTLQWRLTLRLAEAGGMQGWGQ